MNCRHTCTRKTSYIAKYFLWNLPSTVFRAKVIHSLLSFSSPWQPLKFKQKTWTNLHLEKNYKKYIDVSFKVKQFDVKYEKNVKIFHNYPTNKIKSIYKNTFSSFSRFSYQIKKIWQRLENRIIFATMVVCEMYCREQIVIPEQLPLILKKYAKGKAGSLEMYHRFVVTINF